MWWKSILPRRRNTAMRPAPPTLFDEAFLRRLERLSMYARPMLRGGLAGQHPSLRRLPAPTFIDHQPYTASDDLRYVDWNVYARQEHLFVKLGETEQDVDVHLLLDRSASMDYGAADQHKLQYGRMLLAALGYIALANTDRLQATAFDTTLTRAFGPAQSKRQAAELLRHAGAIERGGRSDLATVVTRYSRLNRGGLLVILSDLWSTPDLDRALRAVPPPRWQVLLLHLLHHDEIQPALQGEVELEDSESGEYLPFDVDATTLQAYHTRLTRWCETIQALCGRYGATYARITTDMPLEQAVMPYLRQRRVLEG